MASPRLAIVLPAHNEAANLARLLPAIPRRLDGVSKVDVIVVDDGSNDETGPVARGCHALVVTHRTNLGLGGALITGTEAAISVGADIVVHMDGDGQHAPADLPELLKPILSGELDFVTGARSFAAPMPRVLRFGNRVLSAAMAVLFGVRHPDTQCGYRAFRAGVWPRLRWGSIGYSIACEVLLNAHRSGVRCAVVPVETIYLDPHKGTTPADGVEILLRLLRWKVGHHTRRGSAPNADASVRELALADFMQSVPALAGATHPPTG